MDIINNEKKEYSLRLIKGIARSPQHDENYKILIDHWSWIDLTNDMILNFLMNKYKIKIEKWNHEHRQYLTHFHLLKSIPESVKREVYYKNKSGWSVKTISSEFKINKLSTRAIIYSKQREEKDEENKEKEKKYPYKIIEKHISEAQKYLMQIKQNKITIAKLHKHLEEIGDLEMLSLTGTRYMLKALMKYTYKRATSSSCNIICRKN